MVVSKVIILNVCLSKRMGTQSLFVCFFLTFSPSFVFCYLKKNSSCFMLCCLHQSNCVKIQHILSYFQIIKPRHLYSLFSTVYFSLAKNWKRIGKRRESWKKSDKMRRQASDKRVSFNLSQTNSASLGSLPGSSSTLSGVSGTSPLPASDSGPVGPLFVGRTTFASPLKNQTSLRRSESLQLRQYGFLLLFFFSLFSFLLSLCLNLW